MDEAIAPDKDRGRSDGREQHFEDAELDRLLSKTAALADRIDEAGNERRSIRGRGRGGGGEAVDFAANEAEGEQSENAVEGGLDNLGGGRIKGEDERLNDEIGIGGVGEAVQGGAGGWI